jgi:glycosyltransferase involved in cell wall biosynthesis
MRIAFVVHDFTRALGHGRYTLELARRFARDHDVHVFANTVDPAGADGVAFHHVPAIRANALATIASFALPATLRVGRGWDIIHAQGACCLHFNVITAHICNAGWAQAQRMTQVARTWRQKVFEHLVPPMEAAAYRWFPQAQVIAISHQVRRELLSYYGRGDGVTVIHHGVDTETFAPVDAPDRNEIRRRLGIATDAFVALFVGDLRKGAEVALEVVARTPGVHLVMVSRSATGPYVTRAGALGISDRVAFQPGTIEIAQYYAMADAFLFPSPYDAFGMVIPEAMAAGLPVITARTAGASELISHGVSGFIVESPTDPAPMVAHLSRIAADPGIRRAMGGAARAAALEHDWDRVACETMVVYQRTFTRS